MRFRDGNHTGDPNWIELMERVPYDCGTYCLGSLNHGVPDERKIIEQRFVAILQFKDQMCAKSTQIPGPPAKNRRNPIITPL